MKIEGGNNDSSEGVTIKLEDFDNVTIVTAEGHTFEFGGLGVSINRRWKDYDVWLTP